MPHIIVEYSANLEKDLDARALVHAIHEAALGTEIFELGAIRTRASRREIYEIADGDPGNVFIHVDVNIGAGRDVATRRTLAEAVLGVLRKATASIGERAGLALSVEVRQIDGSTAQRNNNLHARLATKRAATKSS